MGDILSFGTGARRRKYLESSKIIDPGEMRAYIPLLVETIADWRRLEAAISPQVNEIYLIDEMCDAVLSCLRTFTMSAGQWRGRWPQFGSMDDQRNLAKQCINHLADRLSEILVNEVSPAIVTAYERSDQNGTPLKFEFARDLDTFLSVKRFVREMAREIERQFPSNQLKRIRQS